MCTAKFHIDYGTTAWKKKIEQWCSVIHDVDTWSDMMQNLQVMIMEIMWKHGIPGHYVSLSGKKSGFKIICVY